MPIDWDNAAAKDYWVLNRRGVVTQLIGVMSQQSEDVEYYNGETYRDELDAAFTGVGRSLQVNKTGGGGIVIANGDQTLFNGTLGTDTYTYATPSDPHLEQSDSFTHTPPRPLQVTRTRLTWWSGAAGSGSVIGQGWIDEVLEFSSNAFDRI